MYIVGSGGGGSEGGEAVWLVEGEECEGEKGCVYVMGDFDNSLYKTLQGNHRYVVLVCQMHCNKFLILSSS